MATFTCPKRKQHTRGGTSSWRATYEECIIKIWNPPNDRNVHIQNCQNALDDLPNVKIRLEEKIKNLKKGLFFNEFKANDNIKPTI